MGETFDFGEALKRLKLSHRVMRLGWNGKGMWLSLTLGRTVATDNLWSHQNRVYAKDSGGTVEVLPYITMKTADGKIVPWLASQTDVLADDWMVA